MKHLALALVLAGLPIFGISQTSTSGAQSDTGTPKSNAPVPSISLSSKGSDARAVIANLFEQAKQQYVLLPTAHSALYLSLNDESFTKALNIVCNAAELGWDLRDGVYYVRPATKAEIEKRMPAGATAPHVATQLPMSQAHLIPDPKVRTLGSPKPITTPFVQPIGAPKTTPVSAPLPGSASPLAGEEVTRGPLSRKVLWRHVKLKTKKTEIRAVFAEISKQTHIPIVVDASVPAYHLDVNLPYCKLITALKQVTDAAGLVWKLPENHTILITMPDDGPKVAVIKG